MRSTKSILCSLGVMTILLYVLYSRSSPPTLPPMPGTYQYFTDINFEYHTHSFGAISHCDPTFAPSQPLSIEETRKALLELIKSYTATMSDLRADSWIAHRTLFGWYWNRKFVPWDSYVDFQMSFETLAYLVARNMSEYSHLAAGEDTPRTYLLDINPHHTIASTQDVANTIDGRWIDTTTGKYIDITAVHVSPGKTEQALSDHRSFFSKAGHTYGYDELFPLQEAGFEGISVKVPRGATKILIEEYGKKSLTNTHLHWHHFNKASRVWELE